jgi:hypothetical protein
MYVCVCVIATVHNTLLRTCITPSVAVLTSTIGKETGRSELKSFLFAFPFRNFRFFFFSPLPLFSFHCILLDCMTISTHITGSVIDGIFLFFYLSIVDCVCRPHWILKVSAVGPWIILSFSHLSRRQPQPHH